jgi:hypothetical protein
MILYTGVVENRNDPACLGRCQVRVVGLHSENKKDLPTELLPWAYPMQPVTSAAMNGIGHSPTGPVEGTWVIIMFRDEEKQQPIMLGTIGGIPQDTKIGTNYLNDGDDYLIKTEGVNSAGQPPKEDTAWELAGGSMSTIQSLIKSVVDAATGSSDAVPSEQYLGVLTQDQFEKYKVGVARLETTSEPGGELEFSTKGKLGGQNYGAVSAEGRVGKYQLTGPALTQLGYVSPVLNANGELEDCSNQKLADDSVWEGRGGVKSLADFLGNADVQENIMKEWTNFNYEELKRLDIITDKTDPKEITGFLQASHPDGAKRALALINKQDIQDGYGNTTTDLYKNGYASQEGDQPKTLPQNVPQGVDKGAVPIGETKPDGTPSTGTANEVVFGFQDASGVYPLKEYLNEPDTNRLARHDNLKKTIVALKDATKSEKIPLAITKATWNQPKSPYNARYPFNHVYQSESGHVQEFDDTPNNERIHIYHAKGTFVEIDANGTQVNKIVGDGYEIIDRNGYVYVKGAYNLTVDGSTNIFFRSDANIEVTGNAKIYCKNDVDMRVSGKMDLAVAEDLNIECKNLNIKTNETMKVNTETDFFVVTKGNLNLYSKDNFYLTSIGNLHHYAKGNLFLQSDLSTNLLSKSQVNITSKNVMSIFSEGNINVRASATLNLRGDAVAQRSTGRFDIFGGGSLQLGGTPTNINSGGFGAAPPSTVNQAATAQEAGFPSVTALEKPEGKEEPVNSKFEHLTTSPRFSAGAQYFETPDEGDPSEYLKRQKELGQAPNPPAANRPPKQTESVVVEAVPPDGKVVSCDTFKQMTEFPLNTKLSANFYIGDYLPGGGKGYICVARSPHKLVDVPEQNLTKADIVCNMKAHAENVMEALIKIVPKNELLVTSGLRQKGFVRGESSTSQHIQGCAVDIVLAKTPTDRKKHYDLIQRIAASVPHDQLILEFDEPPGAGSKIVWIHLSYNPKGKNRSQKFTMNQHRTTGQGFKLLA